MKNQGSIYLSNDKWKLKSKGSLVYIENSSKNKILAVGVDDNVIEEVLVRNDTRQMWNKGVANSEGYFTLTNSKKVLTAVSVNCIKIKGKFISDFNEMLSLNLTYSEQICLM